MEISELESKQFVWNQADVYGEALIEPFLKVKLFHSTNNTEYP